MQAKKPSSGQKNLPGLYLKLGPLSKNRADLCLLEPEPEIDLIYILADLKA
jgi:hypothetical protein